MNRAPVFAYTPEQHEREHLRFTCTRDGDRLTIRIAAKINGLNARPIRDRALPEIADGAIWVTIDLAEVEEIERRYFGEMLSIAQHAKSRGGAVTILDARPTVFEAFEDNGMMRAFTFSYSRCQQRWPVDPKAPTRVTP